MSESQAHDVAPEGLGGIKQELHCCACSRIFTLPSSAVEGSIVQCPFCYTQQRLRVLSVYVSDPVVAA